MIYVSFNGRLGLDAEIKTDKSGKKYVCLHVATDEFKDGSTNTVWVTVCDYTYKTQRMAAALKKGCLVCVHGIESVGTYVTAQGDVRVNRIVASDRVDFVAASKPQQDVSSTPTANCGTFVDPSTKQPAEKVIMPADTRTDAVDDLPF